MKNNIIIMVLIALVFASGGFFGGMKYQQAQRSQLALAGQFSNWAGGTPGANRVGMRGGQVLGTILSQDATSITVQLVDGSSKIVLISATTVINQAATATAADLKVGTKVSAFGTTNTDGSVSAQNIQINPIMRTAGNPSGIPGGQ